MKKAFSYSLLLSLCTLSTTICYAHRGHWVVGPAPVVIAPAPVVVAQAPVYVAVESEPPAETEEEVEPCPGSNYAWIKGHWQWDGCRWIRVKGHWAVRPYGAAAWESGYWTKHHHHWQWVDGYWR